MSIRPYIRVAPTLGDEAAGRLHPRAWRPMLVVQLVLYTVMVGRFLLQPVYADAPTAEHPDLKRNHILNFVSLTEEPARFLMVLHVAMAWVWIAATLSQKEVVRVMARGEEAYRRYRRVHAATGWTLVLLGNVGIVVGAIIAWKWHGNEPMRRFLMAQPLYFVPMMVLTAISARRASWSVRYHRFWAEMAFLGPAVSSLWTEIAIFVTQRFTPLGPHSGEYWSSVVGGALGFAVVVIPSFFAMRRGLVADAAATG
jgi:hypothetical protein